MPSTSVKYYKEFDWLEGITNDLGWQTRLAALPPSECLWHYTNLSTFEKIIKGGTFHLNRLDRMNDSQEGQWLSSHLERTLSPANYSPTEGTPLDPWRIIKRPADAFAISFSQNPDLLSQWVGYANGGRGIAIGFDPKLLREVCNPITDWKDLADCYTPHTIFCGVEYSSSSEMDTLTKEIAERIRRAADDQHIPGARRYNPLGKSIGAVVGHLNPIFKNKAFEQENEWRIVLFQHGDPDKATSKFSFGYKVTEKDIVRHYEMAFKDSIKKIMIGPLCRADLEVHAFLANHDITLIDIDRSVATLVAR
jgi:hypothetical protein